MREPPVSRIMEIVEEHLPRGWKLIERDPVAPRSQWFRAPRGKEKDFTIGLCNPGTIVCPRLIDRAALYIFLHECGHAYWEHIVTEYELPKWLEEYEAEIYAIEAMRAAGVPMPMDVLRAAKRNIAVCIRDDDSGETVPDIVLRFAYGKGWRKHR